MDVFINKCFSIWAYIIYIICILCSTEQQEDFRKWEKYDDSEESFCESDGQYNLLSVVYVICSVVETFDLCCVVLLYPHFYCY